MKAGLKIIPEGRLRLSRAPAAELGAAALLAQKEAGLDGADFVIVAVAPGSGDDALVKALRDAPAAVKPPAPAKK